MVGGAGRVARDELQADDERRDGLQANGAVGLRRRCYGLQYVNSGEPLLH